MGWKNLEKLSVGRGMKASCRGGAGVGSDLKLAEMRAIVMPQEEVGNRTLEKRPMGESREKRDCGGEKLDDDKGDEMENVYTAKGIKKSMGLLEATITTLSRGVMGDIFVY